MMTSEAVPAYSEVLYWLAPKRRYAATSALEQFKEKLVTFKMGKPGTEVARRTRVAKAESQSIYRKCGELGATLRQTHLERHRGGAG